MEREEAGVEEEGAGSPHSPGVAGLQRDQPGRAGKVHGEWCPVALSLLQFH